MGGGEREALVSLADSASGGCNGILDDEEYGTFSKHKLLKEDTHRRRGCLGWVLHLASQTTSIIIITFVTIMDVLPYGLLIFPPGFGLDLNIWGIQLVLASSAIGQVVYAFMSDFPPASGCFVVENVPFLHSMSEYILTRLQIEGRVEMALPTLFMAFALSSILTGLTFLLLGYLHLGKISSFVPRHVLLGCIGGMGVFILTAGIGVASGVAWEWTLPVLLQQAHHYRKILVTLGLTAALNIINHYYRKPMVVPMFFIGAGLGFFLILWLLKIPIATAQRDEWLFSFELTPRNTTVPLVDVETADIITVFQVMDFFQIRWDLICDQLFTILGIVFFTIIHVPVNTPALAATIGVEADLDRELRAHGFSNLISGLMGGLQNYMAYSISALYYKTGGGNMLANLIVAALLFLSTIWGPSVISYFPRPLAGSLLAHLGFALLCDAVVYPWYSTDMFEYLCIVIIILSMLFLGFMDGLGIGVLLACGTFVVQGSRTNPIHAAFTGDGIRSKEIRTKAQRKLLDFRMQGKVYIIRLRGNIFFGNSEQLLAHVYEVGQVCQGHLRFLLLDFSMVSAVDCNGREMFQRLSRNVTKRGIHIIWAGLTSDLRAIMRSSGCLEPAAMMSFSKDLNKAFAFVEDAMLESLSAEYPSLLEQGAGPRGVPPRSYVFDVLRHLTSETDDVVARLETYFHREVIPQGTTLWRRNDPPTFACLLEKGLLGVPRQRDDPSYAASIAQDPEGSRVRRRLPTFAALLTPTGANADVEFVEYSLPGQFSGEMSLLTKEPRMYSCVAVQESVIWRIEQAALKSLLEEDPYIYVVLQRITLRYAQHRLHCLMLLGQLHSM